MSSTESNFWYNSMRDEMDSMASNQVWDLVKLPVGVKAIECRWVFNAFYKVNISLVNAM